MMKLQPSKRNKSRMPPILRPNKISRNSLMPKRKKIRRLPLLFLRNKRKRLPPSKITRRRQLPKPKKYRNNKN
jgi:hypothetical protein